MPTDPAKNITSCTGLLHIRLANESGVTSQYRVIVLYDSRIRFTQSRRNQNSGCLIKKKKKLGI